MKNIISFSLFGTDPKYYSGAIKNTLLAKELLPDWETWVFYHPNMTNMDSIENLIKIGSVVKNISDYKIDNPESFPYFWRFFAFLEDTYVISRDLDSRLSNREISYISKWIQSSKDYFIIRDHPWHAPVPSGLFGIQRKIIDFENYLIDFVKTQDLRWGADQEILRLYMENINRSDVFYCGYDDNTNYISRDDKNFFIGMQMDEHDNPTTPSGYQCLNYLNELNL
jgi:hypothetical protein